ncbi:hypothetical protein ACS0TY_035479 [Phlomoides rotata]
MYILNQGRRTQQFNKRATRIKDPIDAANPMHIVWTSGRKLHSIINSDSGYYPSARRVYKQIQIFGIILNTGIYHKTDRPAELYQRGAEEGRNRLDSSIEDLRIDIVQVGLGFCWIASRFRRKRSIVCEVQRIFVLIDFGGWKCIYERRLRK